MDIWVLGQVADRMPRLLTSWNYWRSSVRLGVDTHVHPCPLSSSLCCNTCYISQPRGTTEQLHKSDISAHLHLGPNRLDDLEQLCLTLSKLAGFRQPKSASETHLTA